jgi:hypothetical protein
LNGSVFILKKRKISMLGLNFFGYNMDIGHVSIMVCALIGVTLLEDQGVGLVMIFFVRPFPKLWEAISCASLNHFEQF